MAFTRGFQPLPPFFVCLFFPLDHQLSLKTAIQFYFPCYYFPYNSHVAEALYQVEHMLPQIQYPSSLAESLSNWTTRVCNDNVLHLPPPTRMASSLPAE